ncbi:Mitochondrial fission protein, partial [Ascosphaera acerosa]
MYISAEIREIDQKIENLHMMRKIVLDRLAGLEMDETQLENEISQLDINLEDMEEEIALADAAEQASRSQTAAASSPASSSSSTTPSSSEFMSESIYEKVSANTASANANASTCSLNARDKTWRTKAPRMCQPPGAAIPPAALPLPGPPTDPAGRRRPPGSRVETPYTGYFEAYLGVTAQGQGHRRPSSCSHADTALPLRTQDPCCTDDDDSPRAPGNKRSPPILHGHLEPGSQIQQIKTHSDIITALDFDVPFGTLVTAALDDTLRVWDLNLGKCMGHLEGHTASVRCLQVEDNIVASGAMDASIRLWDLGRLRYAPGRDDRGYITGRSRALANGDSQQGPSRSRSRPRSRPRSRSHSQSRAQPPTSPTPPPPEGDASDCPLFTLEAHVDEVTALHFRNETLISGSADKTLRQWDLVKGRCVQTMDVLWAAAQASSSAALSSSVASSLSPLSSTTTTTTTTTLLGRSAPADADFVGALQVFEAALAAGTADGMVRLWDLRSGQVHRSLVGHTGPVTSLQFDDVHLVTGSLDRSIRIWDLRTGSIFDAYAYDKP